MPQATVTRRDFLATALAAPWAGPGKLLRRGEAHSVLVAGAGLAGLSAGYELAQAGHRVTVLEANTRIGGRVHTLRDAFAGDLYAEAGAESFYRSHDLVMAYLAHFGLERRPFQDSRLLTTYYMRGQRLVPGPADRPEWPLDLRPDERALDWHGLRRKYVAPALAELGDPRQPDWPPPALARYDSVPFAEFLRRQGASPGAVEFLRLGYSDTWDDGPGGFSALCLLRDEKIARVGAQYQVRGGNDRLATAFAGKLGDRVRHGLRLVSMAQDARRVEVTVRDRRGLQQQFSADYLVCTLPLTMLPPVQAVFSEEKARAMREMPYTSVTRIFMQTRERIWEQQGLSGFAGTDLPVMFLWDAAAGQPGDRGILQAYLAGEQARRAAALGKPERVRMALQETEKVFPGMQARFESGESVAWDLNPFVRGAFAWFRPGQMTAFMPHLGRPEGRIFFGGEHTSPWFGWMQGALHSGVRCAREVNEASEPPG